MRHLMLIGRFLAAFFFLNVRLVRASFHFFARRYRVILQDVLVLVIAHGVLSLITAGWGGPSGTI